MTTGAPLPSTTTQGTAHRLGTLLLCLAVALWWWPAGAFWQSDDFIAVHYAADAGRAWSDFTHNQYDLQGVVWFYRPLVTLSFWLEQMLAGGPSPFVSHLFNLALHVASAVLVAAIGARLWTRLAGVLAAVTWAFVPAHAGVVWWAVGRVDGLATLFTLASTLAFLRRLDDPRRGKGRWLACLVLALLSKESALAAPALLVAVALIHADAGSRWRSARCAWPSLIVLAGYFLVRRITLGRFLGGYDDATTDIDAMVRGFGSALFRVIAPLWELRDDTWRWLALAPLIALIVASLARLRRCDDRIRTPLLALLATIACAIPSLPLWSQLEQPMNQRLLHLALVPFALWCGRCGGVTTVLLLLAWAQPHLVHTSTQRAVWDEARFLRDDLDDATSHADAPMVFVAGLPRSDASGRFVSFHLGVDRLLQPPFRTRDPLRTLALRPLAQRPDTIRLPYGSAFAGGLPFEAPTLTVFGATTGDRIVELPPTSVPDLTLQYDGPEPIASSTFLDLDSHRVVARVHAPTTAAPQLRVTLFTAGGYLSCVLPNDARADEQGCAFDIASFLRARYVTTNAADNAHVLFALAIAVTFDLDTRYPMLVEAGEAKVDAEGRITFAVRAANHKPLWLTFDRGIPAFLAGGR
ncbi:MAG: hypothetical protein U1F36_23595 [Planctomycetota bacterium]